MNTITEQFAVELLITDTVCWEVIASTSKTVTLRQMKKGAVVSTSEGYLPIVHTEALSDHKGEVVTARLRKDGTYRVSGNALHFTDTPPTFRTDYAF